MNTKTLRLSLAMAVLSLPLLFTNAFAYPQGGQGGHGGCPGMDGSYNRGHGGDNYSHRNSMMSNPEMMKEVTPIRTANRALFLAMETGDIKTIQTAAKKVSQAIAELKNQELKTELAGANRFFTLMTTAKSYKEMRIAYRNVKKETRFMHNRRMGTAPYLLVDAKTYQTINDVELLLEQLNNALASDSESTIDNRIDKLITSLKSIKNVPLKDYIDSAVMGLTDMKKAKGILAKLEYKKMTYIQVQQIVMITAEKK